VWLPDGRELWERGEDVEKPARWYFPPLAASVTAGARLVAYVPHHLIEAAGGTVAYGDTGSLAPIATPLGGLVPCPGGSELSDDGTEQIAALPFAALEQIRERLETINPYPASGPQGRPGLLKIEADNIDQVGTLREAYLHARSTKNYDRYISNDGAVELTKTSEHGLGHLFPHWDPAGNRDWIRVGRTYLVVVATCLVRRVRVRSSWWRGPG
jgi:hypothetical protein